VVLNNHPDVSAKTYQKVRAVIDRLGFKPNAAARSLSSNRSYTNAMVTLVSFDNRNEAAFFVSPLTSVSHHFEQVGEKAVVMIDRLIQLNPEEREREISHGIEITPELVIRQSSARTNSGGERQIKSLKPFLSQQTSQRVSRIPF
jgi:DNA-binding LacI/PurR family transcriptional regulator